MKHLLLFSLLLLALLLPGTAIAHDFEVDGIYYNINGSEASVTYRGFTFSQYSNEYSGGVAIPTTVSYGGTTYLVTSIGNYAFDYCSGLTSVAIPNSVTSIGNLAFYDCSGLTSVTLGNSVTTIGNSAFYGCSGLTSISIPNSVTTISDGAFASCSGLTNIIIPNSVTSIGSSAFSSCTSLTSIIIPNSVTSIGYRAFSGNGLTSIKVASGNSTYDSRGNCNAIIETTSNTLITGCQNTIIPNSVVSIGDGAFSDCSGLTSISIPNSVTSIGYLAFSGNGLTSIDIPNSVTTIGSEAFSNCCGLTSVIIGNSVTDIGYRAFLHCSLSNITVASGNTQFDSRNNCNAIISTATNELFLGCKSTVIPNSVTHIGYKAFEHCIGLTSIIIPNSVIYISVEAFDCCIGLASVTIGNSVTTIDGNAFVGCFNLTAIYSLALEPPKTYSNTFLDCYDATLFVPKESVNAYKEADYWKDFTSIVGIGSVLPGNTFIVDGIYYRVTDANMVSVISNAEVDALYSGDVVIPDSVTYEDCTYAVTGIEDNAFDGCFELTSITIPYSVETIGEQAFQGCTGLTSVTIGSGVTAIGAKAFNYCNALETVKCLGTVPPVMASTDCFSTAAYNRATLLVPRNTEVTYAAADYWYKFAHIDGWGSAGQGDVNGDGVMSIRDVTSLIDVLLGNEMDSFYFDSADLNSNGRIDIGDVTSLIDNLLNGDY